MSEGNIELLREALERWNRADIDGVLEMMAPDVRWHPADTLPDLQEVYEGCDGVRRFFEEFMAPWSWIELEPVEMIPLGDEVLVRAHFRAEGREGVRVDVEFGQRYRFRDGELVRFNGYPSFDEARVAAQREA
jgi:ketosteroid isomerase-like protein